MSFADQWKTAKEKFETATQEKKPSPKFLGVFRKGSDLDSALKTLTSAKTRKDVVKAVATFDKAASDYCNKLTKEIANPSSVPKGDKTVYTTALEKLKKSLEKIKTEAEHMADSLEVTADKTKVDSGAMQAAEQHMAKQRKIMEKLTSSLGAVTKVENEMKEKKAAAERSLKTALAPHNAGLAGDSAGEAVKMFYEEVKKLRTSTKSTFETAKKLFVDPYKNDATTIDGVKGSKEPLPDRVVKEAGQLTKTMAKLDKDLDAVSRRLLVLVQDTLELTKEVQPLDRDELVDNTKHVELRERLIGETDQWAKAAKKDLTDIEKLLVDVKKLQVLAEKAQQQNNKPEIVKQESEAQKLLVTANRIVKKVTDEEDKRTAGTSDLMIGRGDGGVGDKLPPRIGGPLKKRSDTAFGKFDANQRMWLAAVRRISSIGTSISGFVEQIEGYNGKVVPPAEYIKRFTPIVKTLSENKDTVDTRVAKMQGALERAPEIAQQVVDGITEKPQGLKTLTGLLGLAQQMVGNTEAVKSNAESALNRATTIASTAPQVVKVAAATKKLAEEVIDLCNQFEKVYPQAEKAYKKAISDVENAA